MIYEVRLKHSAAKELNKVPKRDQQKILLALDLLSENPLPPNTRKLTNLDNKYRVRVGDWRIVYEIKNNELIVYVIRIAHRKDVYRNL